MKTSRISFLFLLLFLLVPSVASAQSAASKSWSTFWTQFTAAVKSKNKVAVKRLMVTESKFSDGGGGDTRDQWLARLDKEKLWDDFQRTLAKGTVAHNEAGITGRITKDNQFIFEYTGGKWRFFGVMGD